MNMADYYSPTVVQQTIPNADMTPLERLLLSHIFDADPDGDGLYFHTWEGPADMIWVNRAELEAALTASKIVESVANDVVAEQLEKASGDEGDIELDLSLTSWEYLLQDIVRRSPTLRYITAVTAFTCSKMRADGFGGAALFITADAVKGHSTDEFLADCLSEIADDPTDTSRSNSRPGSASEAGDGDDAGI
jgi:hypothetical protein